ncbi:6325_t:CDS:2 [Paraglomus occultum]|uniref:6325_t:CDS:1 n=1 Tax=Paraglomus occultum TaxID=144539 RepID=A0A9N9AJE9_9GLOM|nr:6325_t:CDS:2 [Paraglomus occultum]
MSNPIKPITFVRSKSLELVELTSNTSDKKSGDHASEFYRHVISRSSQQDKMKNRGRNPNNVNRKQEPPVNKAWCSDCELWVDIELLEKHIHGTAHLISTKHETPLPDPIVLNENNLGFRMLRDQGWTYEKGLGIEEQGKRHPISIRIKNDKLGIGMKRQKLENEESKKLALYLSRLEIAIFAIKMQELSTDEVPLPSYIDKSTIDKLIQEGNNVINTQFTSGNEINIENHLDRKTTTVQRQNTRVNLQIRGTPTVSRGEFESKLLGTPNNGFAEKILCATMFRKQYLLLGNEHGLFTIDFSVNWDLIKPKQIIRGCSFKQLHVLDDQGILVALAGKKQQIRLYNLQSLLHLIKHIYACKNGGVVDLSKTAPITKKLSRRNGVHECENCGYRDEDDMKDNTGMTGVDKHVCKMTRQQALAHGPHPSISDSSKQHERRLSNITSQLTDYIQSHINGVFDTMDLHTEEYAVAYGYARDYTKLDQNENVASFVIKETRNYIYLVCILTNNTIALHESSTNNNSKATFELIKTFWVPEQPRWVSVHTDIWVIRNIILRTGKDRLIVIDAHTSLVSEPPMLKRLIPRHEDNPEWLTFNSISWNMDFLLDEANCSQSSPSTVLASPSESVSPSKSPASFRSKQKCHSRNNSRVDVDVSVSSEDQNFSESGLPQDNRISKCLSGANAIHIESYLARDKAVTIPRSISAEVLSPPLANQLFLCTISRMSHIVNIRAEPFHTYRPIQWSSPPSTIILLPSVNDILVVSFQVQTIEVGSLRLGKVVRQVTCGVPVEFLGESSCKVTSTKEHRPSTNNKQREPYTVRKYVFWSCQLGEEMYLYKGTVVL